MRERFLLPRCVPVQFDEARCRRLVTEERWFALDIYLSEFLGACGEPAEAHPLLMLLARREAALIMLKYHSKQSAIGFFKALIEPLFQAIGPYVPLSGYVSEQVEKIRSELTCILVPIETVNREDLIEQILDYIRLYFPEQIGYTHLTDGQRQYLWKFTVILRDSSGRPKKYRDKVYYRCLACGWDKGSKTGIKAMEAHLLGDIKRKIYSCEMVTPRIYDLLGKPPLEIGAACHSGKKRVRKRWIRESQLHNQDDSGPSQSQPLSQPLSRSQPTAGDDLGPSARPLSQLLSQFQPPTADDTGPFADDYSGPQHENIWGLLVQAGLTEIHDDLGGHILPQQQGGLPHPHEYLSSAGNTLPQQPILGSSAQEGRNMGGPQQPILSGLPQQDHSSAGNTLPLQQPILSNFPQQGLNLGWHIDIVSVLNSRRNMSKLVDRLVLKLPIEFVATARGCLQGILEICNLCVQFRSKVDASTIRTKLAILKESLNSVDSNLLVADPDVLDPFTKLNEEVEVLDLQCLRAAYQP